MSGSSIIIFDACVIYPATLRDLLMELALNGLFRAKWTKDIHVEWARNLLKNRTDLTHKQVENVQSLMNKAIPDCLIDGYESIIETINLPDVNDRHVLAAAIRAKADTILTYNIKDFPINILNPYNIEAQHPDDLLRSLIERAPAKFYSAMRKVKARLKNPPICTSEYLDNLESQSLPQTVGLLREYSPVI